MVLPPHARGRMSIAGRTRRLESLIALGETEPSTRYPGYHELFMPVGARVLLDGDDHQLVVRVSLRMTAPPPRPSSQSLSPFLRAVVISAIVHLGLVLCWTQWFAGPR